jgi:hypothetical protein
MSWLSIAMGKRHLTKGAGHGTSLGDPALIGAASSKERLPLTER